MLSRVNCFLFIYISFVCQAAMAESLSGLVFTVDEQGVERPLDGVIIDINRGDNDRTHENGKFTINFNKKSKITPGDKISLSVNKSGYSMLTPYQGELYFPKDWVNEKIIVRLVPFPINFYPNVYFDKKINPERAVGNYLVQIFVTVDRMKAATLVAELKRRKLQARYETIMESPVSYRVIIGPFISEEEAERIKGMVIKDFNLPSDSFVRPRS